MTDNLVATVSGKQRTYLVPFSEELVTLWREAIERTPYTPGPVGGPEYVTTPKNALDRVLVFQSGDLVIPLLKRRTTHFGIVGADSYEGVQTNSFLGVASLDDSVFNSLEALPLKADIILHVPTPLYEQAKRRLEEHHFYPLRSFSYYKVMLPGTYDEWFKRHEVSRSEIRKAIRGGVTIAIGGEEYLDDFYRMYLLSFQRWQDQSKANWHHEYDRFKRMFAIPDSGTKIAIAYSGCRTIATALICCYRRHAAALYGGFDYEYRAIKPSNLLYAEVMRYLIENGCEEYNMGTSNDMPEVDRFKRSLGGKEYKSVILCRHRFRRLGAFVGLFRSRRRPGDDSEENQ
ncbi:MAG: GNAT family N-acetyltransferase [candidate division Zixibacteria bacterium]|nr:GNAT family N-acetyltransferase [candidate division Zixibacteria bacterium]